MHLFKVHDSPNHEVPDAGTTREFVLPSFVRLTGAEHPAKFTAQRVDRRRAAQRLLREVIPRVGQGVSLGSAQVAPANLGVTSCETISCSVLW